MSVDDGDAGAVIPLAVSGAACAEVASQMRQATVKSARAYIVPIRLCRRDFMVLCDGNKVF
jgi:hypothetical protein